MKPQKEKIDVVQVVDDSKKVENAYAHQYENLASEIANLVHTKDGILAEVGCGEGQLTIPLAKLLPRHRLNVVDTFTGPYSGIQSRMNQALIRAKLKSRSR